MSQASTSGPLRNLDYLGAIWEMVVSAMTSWAGCFVPSVTPGAEQTVLDEERNSVRSAKVPDGCHPSVVWGPCG